ncbi:HD-GYP domain-containing protein [Lederbergia citrea]|uniref:HD domain-containing protein n=1 Tax=Lederbergia citrea TaxID=2833581 RepID=A0A942UM56_9BACI|nr:HD domain-containing phosphohydrolase [Lederbergia citrea]MBS4223900.1 HD domain-containing protein [Lederbergia citrea]
MKVKVKDLQTGCVLQKDVMGKTSHPLIPAKTILTKEHIEVLLAFLVKEVEIRSKLENGEHFKVVGNEDSGIIMPESAPSSFLDYYQQAVKLYKKEYQSWQAGLNVDISIIRSIIIPLLEKSEEDREWIRIIHLYSNKDDYPFHHAISVSLIAGYIAKGLGYDKGQYTQVALAGCLADCGMAKMSAKTLFKEDPLTGYEWKEIKKHPINSYQMIKNNSLLKPETKLAILQHHERLDGTGYPIGVSGNRVHMHSQIVAIADIYHAMTTERHYKQHPLSPFRTLQIMEEDLFGQFHMSIIKVLASAITSLSVGTVVKLSDDRIGEIVFVKSEALTRPLIKIKNTEEIIDLEKNRHTYISDVIFSS